MTRLADAHDPDGEPDFEALTTRSGPPVRAAKTSTWEERMAERARTRQYREGDASTPTHLHGTAVVCPCGVAVGGTCIVILDDDDPTPEPNCEHCGLEPAAEFRPNHDATCSYYEADD